MKIAVPVFKNGVSPRIDVSDGFLVYDINDGKVMHKGFHNVSFEYPAELIVFLKKNNIEQIICGGYPRFFLRALLFYDFKVFASLSGDPDDILKLFVEGKLQNLPAFSPPADPNGRRCRRLRCRPN